MICVYNQIWKKIEGYPDYEVSNYGQVKSWRSRKGRRKLPKKIGVIGRAGYLQICLYGKKNTHFSVHTLVLSIFGSPKISKKHHCCHNDGNPRNNHISNLRWGTPKENHNDMIRHGKMNSVLKKQDVLNIRIFYSKGLKIKKISDIMGFKYNTVRDVVNNTSWKHIKTKPKE